MIKHLMTRMLFACLAVPCAWGQEAPRPNIVVFLADDLGYGDLACYGNPIIRTPHLDRLAAEGVRMLDCHSGGTVCSPSRAAILTGRNPYRSGFFYIQSRSSYLRSEEVTVAEVLREAGYQTGFWGKWHLSTLESGEHGQPRPHDQGFDYWMGTTHNAFDRGGGPRNYRRFLRDGEPVGEVDGWYCDVIVDDACEWLRTGRDREVPFFMYVCSHEPHTPIAPPQEYIDRYGDPKIDALEKRVRYGGVARPDADLSANKKEYYATVDQLDDAFGRLMQTLEELGLRDDTLVLFTSDNGPEAPVTDEESLGLWDDPIRDKCFGTPGVLRGMKRFPFEGGHRVPGIARWPGKIPAGTTSATLFNGTDLLPTLCALAGAELPTGRKIDGVDAFAAFLGETLERPRSPIWFYPHHEDCWFRMPHASLRTGKYTLLGWLPEKADEMDLDEWMRTLDPVRFELYDLVADPAQAREIGARHPDLVKSMSAELVAHWREMRDEGLAGKRE